MNFRREYPCRLGISERIRSLNIDGPIVCTPDHPSVYDGPISDQLNDFVKLVESMNIYINLALMQPENEMPKCHHNVKFGRSL